MALEPSESGQFDLVHSPQNSGQGEPAPEGALNSEAANAPGPREGEAPPEGGAEGQKQPSDDGTHNMMDGTMLTTTQLKRGYVPPEQLQSLLQLRDTVRRANATVPGFREKFTTLIKTGNLSVPDQPGPGVDPIAEAFKEIPEELQGYMGPVEKILRSQSEALNNITRTEEERSRRSKMEAEQRQNLMFEEVSAQDHTFFETNKVPIEERQKAAAWFSGDKPIPLEVLYKGMNFERLVEEAVQRRTGTGPGPAPPPPSPQGGFGGTTPKSVSEQTDADIDAETLGRMGAGRY